MINGQEYSWQSVNFFFLGRPVAGVLEVSYTTKRDKKNIMATGSKPIARARGAKSYEGKIKVLQSELQALQRAANNLKPGADLTDIGMFDIQVCYVPDPLTGAIITDVLKDCEFTEVTKGMKVGDLNMEVELPLIIGDIQYN